MSLQTEFDAAVDRVCQKDSRYAPGAYYFLRDSLTHTLESLGKEGRPSEHVQGRELLIGFRDLALKEFGPMAATLLAEWGISKCADLGEMVFNLIEVGAFGRQENDSREDFSEIFDFHESFVKPFQPRQLLNH